MASSSRKNWRIHINGVVQSVGFRPFIKNLGDKVKLKGYVCNLGDAGVEIVIQSDEAKRDEFIDQIRNQLPELAVITDIQSNPIEVNISFLEEFEIKKSYSSSNDKSGFSAIPP
ncbi:MAG: acylphosphatase, partial [Candidatus Kariarchaeaceae archaeon]